MNRACWPIAADGRYWIAIALGTNPSRLMIDTGVTDRAGLVGFDLAPAEYDRLERSGQLLAAGPRMRQDASGAWVWLRCGFLAAQVLHPVTGVRIGPPVRCLAVRNFANVPSRVGAAFFHRLTGCRVVWELDTRTWCVEYQ
jgi:hypothetical protein